MNDEVKLYSSGRLVSSATVMTGKDVRSGGNDSMYVSSGGTANSTTVSGWGSMFVSSGGVASSTTVNSYGSMVVSSGGVASSTTVNSGGCVILSAGASATKLVLESGGQLNGFSFAVSSSWENIVDGIVNVSPNVTILDSRMTVSSGGTATSTTVNYNGRMVVSSGGVANVTTVNGRMVVSSGGVANVTTVNGRMVVSSGGVANSTTVNFSGGLYVFSGGVANSTTVSGVYANLIVSSGGVASSTTVNDYGNLIVSSGGVATSTTVNSGYLYVSSGGVANRTTVNASGYLHVSNGGVATSTTVNSYGSMHISSGGTTTDTTVNSGGYMSVSGGGVANSTTVDSGGSMFVYGGTANSTTVNGYSGTLYISSGGVANSTTVNYGGRLYVSSGGMALSIKENGGYVGVYSGAHATFTPNSFSGLVLSGAGATLHSGTTANSTTVNGGSMYVSSGGVANVTTVNYYGSMHISSGGTTTDTTVNSGGYMSVSGGGTALSIKENGGYVSVDFGANVTFTPNSFSGLVLSSAIATLHSGTTANSTTVSGWNAALHVSNGGVANSTTVNGYSGTLYISSGGVANVTTVNYNGRMVVSSGGTANSTTVSGWNAALHVSNGGVVSGSLQIANGAIVSAYNGAIIDFTVAKQTEPSTALINNWSLISGGANANYTITVKADQACGTYTLADGVADFANTVTLKNTTAETIGVLSVNSSLIAGETCYSLNRQDSQLSLDIKSLTPITITASSASKKYDGMALTNSGYTYTQGVLEDGDELVVTVEGSLTDAGTAANKVTSCKVMRGDVDVTANYTFADSVAGTLTVTKRQVTLTSNSDSRKYNGNVLEGTVMVGGDGFVAGEATASASSITDVGAITNTITINEGAGYKDSNYNITKAEGTLEVKKRLVTLTSADDTKIYDGTPLTNDTVTVSGDGFVLGEGATYDVTGSQTDVGTSKNTFSYAFNKGTQADNYTITSVEGDLTVAPIPITITAGSAEKMYDGISLTADYTYSGNLQKGDELTATVNSMTNAGTAASTITSYSVWHGKEDVTDHYTFTTIDGVLNIYQRSLTLTSQSSTKMYDGTALTQKNVVISGDGLAVGEALDFYDFTERCNAGYSSNSFSYQPGNVRTNLDNYAISVVEGTLTVTRRDVTLTSASDSKVYDGTPLTNDSVTVSGSGWVTGEGATYTVTGSQTEVGSSLNTFTYTLNAETKAANYNITKTEGTLTVTPVAKIPFFVTGDFAGVGSDYLGKEGDSDSVLHIYQTGAEWGNTPMEENWKFYDSVDFNGDGKADLLRSDEVSKLVVGEVSNGNGSFTPQVLNALGDGWQILGTGDFNGNGVGDVLVANPTAASATVGLLGYWEGGTAWNLINGYSAEWEMVSTNDFNGDGKTDMLWKNEFIGEGGKTYNAYCTWIVDNANDWRMVSVANPDEWNFLCTGDFNGDNTADIAMINGEGVVGIWGIQDGYLNSWSILSAVDTNTWNLAGAGDFNGDGTDDIAWCNADTNLAGYWQINNKQLTSWQTIATLA